MAVPVTTARSQTLEVLPRSGCGGARQAARDAAAQLGFSPDATEEIALAITELATNLQKHTSGGRLVLTHLSEAGRMGLQLESIDLGPGIPDVERALVDGYSTVGSRGTGLGSLGRLMDHLDIESQPGKGTHVVCRKWVRVHSSGHRIPPLSVGVATRPRLGNLENGDSFVVKEWDDFLLAGVIDGLGHGAPAHRASATAREYVERHYDQPLQEVFQGTDRVCRSTRGVVMALARFDWKAATFEFASLGNIEVRVHPRSGSMQFSHRRGVVGLNVPAPKPLRNPWPAGHLLVLHSDGLRTNWDWKEFPDPASQTSTAVAWQLLHKLGKEDDDATVIVVKNNSMS